MGMTSFDWSKAPATLTNFGGIQQTLYVPKTGLPFFDVLRLYGMVDRYIGLKEEITVSDRGYAWEVRGKVREHEEGERDKQILVLANTLGKSKKAGNNLTAKEAQDVKLLRSAVSKGQWPSTALRNVSLPLNNPDSALKDGVRGTAASSYKGLETGFGEDSRVFFVDALLALAGQKRTETIAGILFLPVFEGLVDFSKVVSPLRAWSNIPNVLCAQALTLLALKTALFSEGYADRLTAVVYNTDLDGRKSYNYSGIIEIKSTALHRGRFQAQDPEKFDRFVPHFYRTFRNLVGRAWKGDKATGEVEDALLHAYWLFQPERPKNLSTLITSMERQKRDGRPVILTAQIRTAISSRDENYIQEIFQMSYGKWDGDHETVRRFARAVASGIFYARPVERGSKSDKDYYKEVRGKWYDEVTMLRSAPTPKAFVERALILLEQGRRASPIVASEKGVQDFAPDELYKAIGQTRSEFETFRDLFRMYLIQESKAFKAPDSTNVQGSENEEGSAENENSIGEGE